MGWVGPAISGVTQLAGAAVGGKGAKKAADTQDRYAREALEYTKQKDAQDRADREKDRELARAAHDAEQARLAPSRARQAAQGAAIASMLRARGINVPNPGVQSAQPFDPTGTVGSTPTLAARQQPTSLAAFYSAPYSPQNGGGIAGGMTPALEAPDAVMTVADFFRRRQDNIE